MSDTRGEPRPLDPPFRHPHSLVEFLPSEASGRSVEPADGHNLQKSSNETSKEQAWRPAGRGTTVTRWHRFLIEEIAWPLTAMPIVSFLLAMLVKVYSAHPEVRELAVTTILAVDVLTPAILISVRAAREPTLDRYGKVFVLWAAYSFLVHLMAFFIFGCFFSCLFGALPV